MPAKIARVLLIGGIAAAWAVSCPDACKGWSLLDPFSSQASTDAKTKKSSAKKVEKEPSTFDKINSGTKNFFNKTGETLGLKKPEPKKKAVYATPRRPEIQTRKKTSSSWLDMFKSEEPKKPDTVPEWMNNKRLDP